MATIVVHTQGTRIEARSKHLRFRPPGTDSTTRDLPLLSAERLLLFGRIELTNRCIHLLCQEGCDVTWFTRGGRFLARLDGGSRGNVAFRRCQFRCADDPHWCLAMARQLIGAKIDNQRSVLQRAGRKRDPVVDPLLLAELEQASNRALAAGSLESLRGIEGTAARRHFAAWARGCDGFIWEGRNRRPPKDPLNAALSLGYTLLLAECDAHCRAAGADTWLGFFHSPELNAPSLALDLMENLRPLIVDRLILDMARHKRLKPEHFTCNDDDGCRFTDEAFRRYVAAFEQRMRHHDDELGLGGRALIQDQLQAYRQACELHDATRFTPARLRT